LEQDVEVQALTKRFLAKKFWVILTKRVAPIEEMQRHLKAHLKHQIDLEKSGIMYGAGPCRSPGESDPAFGLIIIRASDEKEARRIADSDPMHVAGVRRYEIYQWTMNEGRIHVSLDFSDQSYRFE
jgi:uncharacterized protein YciI